MSYLEQKEKQRKDYLNRINKSGRRKCPGHYINKQMGIKNRDCYDEQGQCLKCGGWNKQI